MTAQILFHPNITAGEAVRIAREHGGRMMWLNARLCIIRAQILADAADAAVRRGHYETALQKIRAADHQIAEVQPCQPSA